MANMAVLRRILSGCDIRAVDQATLFSASSAPVLYSRHISSLISIKYMKFIIFHTCLLMSLIFVSCASRNASAQDSKPEFQVTAKNPGDALTILDENSQTVIEIQSEAGIGSASLELVSGSMPDSLLLRLHLAGLEEFQVRSAQDTVSASISSGGLFELTNQSVLLSQSEIPIGSIHPLWMDTRIVSETKSIPLKDGYFEVIIPSGFIRRAGGSFEIHWIDFYR